MWRTMCARCSAVLVFGASLGAQVSVVATTFDPPGAVNGVRVGSVTIAPGTDVTSGYSLQDAGVPNPPFGSWSASGDFVLAMGMTELYATLTQTSVSPFDTMQTTSTSSRAAIELVYTSAIAIDVDVEMTVPAETVTSCSQQWGSVTVLGQPTFTTDTGNTNCVQDPFMFPPVVTCSRTVPATIGPGGLRIQLIGDTWSSGGLFAGPCMSGSARSTVAVAIRARSRTTSYGTGCGASMHTTLTDLANPTNETIHIEAPAGLFSGVLLIGTQQISLQLPFTSCDLLTDALVAIPFNMPPSGRFRAVVVPPPPGVLTTQAVAYAGSTLTMSNGLQW